MQLVIKSTDNDGRLEPIRRFVTTPWTWIVADHRDDPAFARALQEADAMVSMNWPASFPPAPGLRLLQLPGAGTDDIDFDSLIELQGDCVAGHEQEAPIQCLLQHRKGAA